MNAQKQSKIEGNSGQVQASRPFEQPDLFYKRITKLPNVRAILEKLSKQ